MARFGLGPRAQQKMQICMLPVGASWCPRGVRQQQGVAAVPAFGRVGQAKRGRIDH